MNSSKILPMLKPELSSYHHNADLLSIISNESERMKWIVNNYIQIETPPIIGWDDHMRTVYYFPYNIWEGCPLIYYQRLGRDFVAANWDSIIDLIISAIDLDYYVYLDVDRYYIPGTSEYQNNNTDHDIFIFGYNRNKEEIYFSEFTGWSEYEHLTVSFKELQQAYISLVELNLKWTVVNGIELIKPIDEPYRLDVSLIVNSLNDYLNSCNSYKNHSPDKKWYTEMHNFVYGMDVYKKLIYYLEYYLPIHSDRRDTRTCYLMWEHKKIMLIRIKYLGENGYLNNAKVLYEEYEKIEQKMLLSKNLLLKYYATENLSILTKITEIINEIIKEEEKVLRKLLSNIKNYSEPYESIKSIKYIQKPVGEQITLESETITNTGKIEKINWTSDTDIVDVNKSSNGTDVILKSAGTTIIKGFSAENEFIASYKINIYKHMFKTNLNNITPLRGLWYQTEDGFKGDWLEDNSFALSGTIGENFIYEADINTCNCSAAALLFKADENLKGFYCANIDVSGKVKLWRPWVELSVAEADIKPYMQYHLKVQSIGKNIKVFLEGKEIIDVNDDIYRNGYFGFNIFEKSAIFQNVYHKKIK